MNENIRIRLSVGLIVVAVVHAVLLGLVFPALYRQSTATPVDNSWEIPDYQPARATAGQIEKLQQPTSVNLQAQGEIKQQRRILCPPYPPTNLVVQPSILSPTVLPPSVVQPVPTPLPAPVPVNDSSSQLWPAPSTPIAKPAVTPPKKLYQLALFVGNDTGSKQLQQWFEQHAGLAKLKGNCEFQVYTTSNAIYRARFSDIVPADQFPVVLFQDNTGGHVHAAGRTMIPATADELYSDLRHGYDLYMQAKQAQVTGAVKTRGYSWDDAITPALYLSTEDCPDGYCPTEPSDTWRPGDRVRDLLFDDNRDARSGLLWVSAGEIATLALIVVAVILLGFILIKRGM